MAKIDLDVTRKGDEVDEAFVPLLLRITICVSRALGATPARLRRARGCWQLAASPPLAKIQRLIVVITNIMVLSALSLDFLSEKHHRVRVGQTALTNGVYIVETSSLVFVYSLGVLTEPLHLKHTISILQQIQKIKTSIKGRNRLKYSKAKHVLLILYIAWQMINYFILYNGLTSYQNMQNNTYGYQAIVIAFLQLQWCMMMAEISSTLTLVNDELEILLKHATTARQLEFGNEHIHSLHVSYDTICAILKQVDQDSGPFLLCLLFLIFLHLLITPYNLIAVILNTTHKRKILWYIRIAVHFNWSLIHLCHILMFMEPCHWLQEQRERTGRLLNRIVCQAYRSRLDRTQLDAFLLQTQMNDCTVAPCGVFTISRPLLASIVGGVATYLIIMIQFQAINEEL